MAMKTQRPNERGFTLLEVIVALAILSIGAALTMSLISGSLRNVRKVQLRSQTIQHAESVLEVALLDESIKQPTTLQGDFEDGTRWIVQVEEIPMPIPPAASPQQLQFQLPVKALSYSLQIMSPESTAPDLRLQTVKLVGIQENLGQGQGQLPPPVRMPQ